MRGKGITRKMTEGNLHDAGGACLNKIVDLYFFFHHG